VFSNLCTGFSQHLGRDDWVTFFRVNLSLRLQTVMVLGQRPRVSSRKWYRVYPKRASFRVPPAWRMLIAQYTDTVASHAQYVMPAAAKQSHGER
jgi:hypothetical protein